MATPNGYLIFDEAILAKGFDLPPEDVRAYFTDGRRVSFILERRLARNVLRGTLAPGEGDAFDVEDKLGRKWEVRSVTRRGTYFTPSEMVGKGRHFREKEFLEKLDKIYGFIISDIDLFPKIPFWMIRSTSIKELYSNKKLGKNAKVSQKTARIILGELPFIDVEI